MSEYFMCKCNMCVISFGTIATCMCVSHPLVPLLHVCGASVSCVSVRLAAGT